MTAQEILNVHRNVFFEALKSRDFAALSELYSKNYTLVRPDGSVLNRTPVLADLKDGGLVFKSIELIHEEVQTYGNAASIMGESRVTAVRGSEESTSHFRFIAFYAECHRSVKLVYFQGTTLPSAGPRVTFSE